LKMHHAVRAAIRAGLVRSAHDLAEGGLLVALAECAIGGSPRLGATIRLALGGVSMDALLFGESQSRALLTAAPENVDELWALFQQEGVPAQNLGTVGGDRLAVEIAGAGSPLVWDVAELFEKWDSALAGYLA
jgi:phosphoribosylformylglycinamidine synthase